MTSDQLPSKQQAIKGGLLADIMGFNQQIEGALLVFQVSSETGENRLEWRSYLDFTHSSSTELQNLGREIQHCISNIAVVKRRYEKLALDNMTPTEQLALWERCAWEVGLG